MAQCYRTEGNATRPQGVCRQALLVHDSGDEFTSIGFPFVDEQNRPYVRFRTSVGDWKAGGQGHQALAQPLRQSRRRQVARPRGPSHRLAHQDETLRRCPGISRVQSQDTGSLVYVFTSTPSSIPGAPARCSSTTPTAVTPPAPAAQPDSRRRMENAHLTLGRPTVLEGGLRPATCRR